MREEPQAVERNSSKGAHRVVSDLDGKYWLALAMYAVLAALAWLTMDEGKIPIHGRLLDLRLVPLVILGGLALRTMLARHADKIRRGADEGGKAEGDRSAAGRW